MKLRIISDGVANGTRIVNAETGEPLDMVTAVKWEIDVDTRAARAVIHVALVEVDLVCEPEIIRESLDCHAAVPPSTA